MLRGLDPTLASTGPFLQQLNPMLRYLEFNQTKLSDFLAIAGVDARRHPRDAAGLQEQRPRPAADHHDRRGVAAAPLTRTKANRGNAYLRPDAARDPEKMILPSFDCDNSGEKVPTNTPGCRVQGVVPFEGRTGASRRCSEASPAAG